MYTDSTYVVEDDSNNYNNYDGYSDYSAYEDNINYQESSSKNGNNGLIVKIIIIVLCLIVLVWLVLSLKKSNSTNNDNSVHMENVEKVRLGAEKYFFLQDNMPKGNETKTVTLNSLISKDLVSEIVDANKKTCDKTQTFATLNEESSYYVLKVNLLCSTKDKQEVFHYNKSTYACIDCNGKTNMTGDNKPDEKNKNNDSSNAVAKNSTYSCTEWSEWSDVRVIDSSLEERTRVVVLGVKKGGSSNTATKTSNSLRLYSLLPLSSTSTCPSGYQEDGDRCLSTSKTRGDLTYLEYTSDDYKIYNKPCDSMDTEYINGKYVMVYKGCLYSEYKEKTKNNSSTKDNSSKEKSSSSKSSSSNNNNSSNYDNNNNTNNNVVPVTPTVPQEPDVYTTDYYEEKDLPVGYTKVAGSEKTQYSYKLKKCEK